MRDVALKDRLQLAHEALPRDSKGQLPKIGTLEKKHGIHKATLDKAMKGERKRFEPDTLALFAKALGVSVDFLLDETPTPERTRWTDRDERYPSRVAALRALQLAGEDPEVIEIIREKRLKSDDDPGETYWAGGAVTEARELLRLARSHREDPDEDDRPRIPGVTLPELPTPPQPKKGRKK